MLLDKILSEIKNKGLRVLILFQFIGGLVPHSIGDILDDYLRQRFGEDSYERVDSGIALSKKQLALNMFNDKGKGRFVFLLENRACAPSIKLSSVDTIIVFGSDWNPSNDLKALQKINIDFQTEQLTVFRLYTPHTLEEKSLRFYTENMVLDNRLDSLSPSIMHMLLMWGTFYLFKKFDELQDPKIQHSGSIFPGNERLLEETFQEVVSLLPPVTNVNSPIKNSAILKMKQKVSFVSKSTLFFGESQPCFSDREQPHIYWNKLLEGRVDVGSVTGLVERPRRKVHRFVPSSTKLAENEDQIKNQKAADISNVASSSPVILAEDISGEEFTTHLETGSTPVIPRNDHVLETSSSNMVELEDGIDSRTTQQHLHELLKPELLKLCTALRLPKSVVDVAEVSLDYVMKSHQVPKESESILQAFLMSLCWTSASMLKYGVDHEASVMLAKEQLLFKCEKTEVKSVYKRLRRFRPYLKINILSKVVDQSSKDNHENINSNSVPHERLQELAGKTISEPEGRRCIDNEGPLLQGEGPKSEELDVGVNHKNTYHKDGADQEKASETTILLHKVYSLKKKRMKYIIDKQKEEFSEFLKFREMEFSKITKEYRACLFDIEKESDFFIKEEKRRIRSQDFRDRKTSHNNRMNSCGKNLTDKQRNLRDREAQTYSYWVEQAKAGRSVEPYLLLRLPNILFRKEDLENASQNLANEIAAKMSQNGNANEGVTSKPLTSGLDNIPAISGLAVATVRASGVSVTSSDASSVLTTASQADLEGQGTLICSEAVKNTSTVGSVDVLASMTLDNQADSVTRPLEHNILTKSNHITAVDSETDSTHATLETDQIGKPDTSLRQKNGSASQMADRLTTELGHEQVSSVVPGERSAPGGARDHDNEVAGPDALTSSSSAVQVHVSTVDHERPVSAEMEGDTGLGSSQAGVSAGSLDPFLSLSRQVVQASSAGSDGRSTSAETVRDSEHGVAELESFHEAVAPVAQPLDACPSSAEHVTEAHFCMDSSRGSICAETAEGLCGLESPCHAWGPVQQPLGTFPLSAERAQVHSANPNEGSATTESARAETAKEHDHSLGRSDHAGSPVQQPLGAIPLSAQGVQVSSANHDERSASAESAKVETTEPVHGLGDLQSPCHAGGPVQQPFDTLPLSAKEVHISCGNPDERSTYVEPVRAETGRDHGLGRLATPYERSASAETARESSRAVAFVSLPQLRVSLQQPYDASHSSAERVEHCPSAFWPASLPLPPLDGVRITSSNTGAGTTGSESGGFSTALGSLVDYPDPLRRALVRMCMEADQAKMLYEDEKVRLAAERDKVIEEVKRKYAEKFQEAKLKCAVAEEELTKLQLNRCLAVIFWRFLATGPRKLVVQPGNCSIGASFQQSGYGPHGSAAHRTDLVSTDRNRPSSASPLIAGNLQVSCGSRDLRPTPVPSRPPPTNPADLVYLSDDDQL